MVNYQNNNKDEFKNKNNFIKYQDSRTKREYFFKGVCLASEHKISRKSPYPWLFNLFTMKRKYLSLYNREREDTHELTHSPAPSLKYLHYPLPLILKVCQPYIFKLSSKFAPIHMLVY